MDLLRPKLLVVSLLGNGVPQTLYRFTQRREYLAVCFTSKKANGSVGSSRGGRASAHSRTQSSRGVSSERTLVSSPGPLVEKGCFWLSDFSLSSAGLRCGKPDALGHVPHDHGRKKVLDFNLQGAGLRGAEDSTLCGGWPCASAAESCP